MHFLVIVNTNPTDFLYVEGNQSVKAVNNDYSIYNAKKGFEPNGTGNFSFR